MIDSGTVAATGAAVPRTRIVAPLAAVVLLALATACASGTGDGAVWIEAPSPASLPAAGVKGAQNSGSGTGRAAPAAGATDSTAPVLTGARPVFGIGTTRHGPAQNTMYGLSVVTCGNGRPMWVMGTGGVAAPPPSRVVYGTLPRGYSSEVGPRALTPGCYRAIVSNGGSTRFVVSPSGAVTEDTTRHR